MTHYIKVIYAKDITIKIFAYEFKHNSFHINSHREKHAYETGKEGLIRTGPTRKSNPQLMN